DPVDTVLTSGTGSFTAPSYAAFMDVGVIGGGASGATGDNGVTTAAGSGAPAAVWQSTTVAVKPGDVFNYSVGIGGARRNGVKTSGENGTASTITKGGSTVVASAGSIGPAGNTANNTRTGRGAAASSIAALALPGSADVNSPGNQDDTTIVDGNPPGGGGLGGPSVGWMNNGSTKYSGMGGRGEIRYRFRSY
ncbi:hypothetical protein AXK57_16395, partial [Tsukamurella pulmonis]|uniref:glycine-rich domain-containing protein n=1 Tax=Tsukamurella pulmonis TaxID=47312 RepID=UPI000799F7E1